MAHIQIEGVAKRFGSTVALDGVDLSIERGEFVCILGPSGCGKTTLLRVLAGLTDVDAGALRIEGRDCTRMPPAQRNYGIMFQSYALFPNLTVAQNIGYGLSCRRAERAQRDAKVADALAMIGLAEHAHRYPHQLSGGQQQRVALARAIVLRPDYLLLDEPLSALDAKVRAHLRAEIRRLQRSLSLTTIMVTHDQEEALSMADRIVVMNQARIEQVGAPREIYEAPSTPYVADFIGTVNFIGDYRAIRPENIHLVKGNRGGRDGRGRIRAMEYRGAMVRLYIEHEGAELVADMPSALCHSLREGGYVTIDLPDELMITLDRVG